jgi:hypothetical protein
MRIHMNTPAAIETPAFKALVALARACDASGPAPPGALDEVIKLAEQELAGIISCADAAGEMMHDGAMLSEENKRLEARLEHCRSEVEKLEAEKDGLAAQTSLLRTALTDLREAARRNHVMAHKHLEELVKNPPMLARPDKERARREERLTESKHVLDLIDDRVSDALRGIRSQFPMQVPAEFPKAIWNELQSLPALRDKPMPTDTDEIVDVISDLLKAKAYLHEVMAKTDEELKTQKWMVEEFTKVAALAIPNYQDMNCPPWTCLEMWIKRRIEVPRRPPPKYCPFCGSAKIEVNMVEWAAGSTDDPSNKTTLMEHQCKDCERKSFFTGG